MKMVLLGAGRMGQVHAAHLHAHPVARLHSIVDADPARAQALADRYACSVKPDAESALADAQVDGVLICTPTGTHVDLIELAASRGKPIFCEKPIDLYMAKVDSCLAQIAQARVPLMIGFHKRFDRSFRTLREEVAVGKLGRIEMVRITSRDSEPPSAEYARLSGGIFRDMTIHDLDMARWLLPDEPVEVFATGSCLIDPGIGRAGDVDTAVVVLRTGAGAVCTIENSRRAVYGTDQRIEVFGERGMVQADNPRPTTLARTGAQAIALDKPPWSFRERFADAYRAELDHFVEVVAGEAELLVDGLDGRAALALADAATQSLAEGRPIQVSR
jgi:myo-inositol 2-dehydrogenase/D-chiro-inositol 1-dehydrogenase